jgi:hypothetical protein
VTGRTFINEHTSGEELGYFSNYTGRTTGVRFPVREMSFFSPHQRVQTGSGAHPAFYPMGTRSSYPGGEAAEA